MGVLAIKANDNMQFSRAEAHGADWIWTGNATELRDSICNWTDLTVAQQLRAKGLATELFTEWLKTMNDRFWIAIVHHGTNKETNTFWYTLSLHSWIETGLTNFTKRKQAVDEVAENGVILWNKQPTTCHIEDLEAGNLLPVSHWLAHLTAETRTQ